MNIKGISLLESLFKISPKQKETITKVNEKDSVTLSNPTVQRYLMTQEFKIENLTKIEKIIAESENIRLDKVKELKKKLKNPQSYFEGVDYKILLKKLLKPQFNYYINKPKKTD